MLNDFVIKWPGTSLFCLFCFRATHASIQGSLLVVCSGITSTQDYGTICGAGIKFGLTMFLLKKINLHGKSKRKYRSKETVAGNQCQLDPQHRMVPRVTLGTDTEASKYSQCRPGPNSPEPWDTCFEAFLWLTENLWMWPLGPWKLFGSPQTKPLLRKRPHLVALSSNSWWCWRIMKCLGSHLGLPQAKRALSCKVC